MVSKNTMILMCFGSVFVLSSVWIINPRLYVYDNYQNRGLDPASLGEGPGTLRIHKLTGEIQKYCYDPYEVEFWVDWWEPVGKAVNQEEKEEIITYFKQLQEAERDKHKKQPIPSLTLETLLESADYKEKR